MAIVGVWKVACIGLGIGGEAIVNTFHFGPNGADVDVTALTVADGADGVIPQLIQQLVTTDWSYLKCTALCVHGINIGKSAESAVSAPLAGLLAAPSAPMTVAMIGRRRGSAATRHNRGRAFFSPIPVASVDVQGKWTDPGGVAAVWASLAIATIPVGGIIWNACLWDSVHSQAIEVQVGDVAPLVGVQRRRRLRQPN